MVSEKNKNIVYCSVPERISGSNQPDGWYQGVVSFDDGVWSKNVSTGESKNILSRLGADIMGILLAMMKIILFLPTKIMGHCGA